MCHSCCREHTRRQSQAVSTWLHDLYAVRSPRAVADVLGAAKEPISNVVETVGKLSQAASKMPYYKFNNMWSRQMQGAVCLVVLG
jgi:hypothetical protein